MKKQIILPPINPNQGVQAAYRQRLDRLIDEMHGSLMYWLSAAYKANAPEMATDASPAMNLRNIMGKLSKRWQDNFDVLSLEMAKYFAQSVSKRVDGALTASLKKSGMQVPFKMTAEMNDVMQATIGEQVGLIKSIASQHLSAVEGDVMRSVAAGGDLKTLNDTLIHRYGLTKKRAALIARDQNSKATATLTRVRQKSLGATEAIWRHSHAGKEPRPSHVAANGKTYKIDEGMYLDGEQVWPGTAINCRCTARTIIPGLQ